MSVLVVGIEKPINCRLCFASDDESRFCRAAKEYIPMLGKPKFCPLIELPDHGDLIDRDEAADDACVIWGRNSSSSDAMQEVIEHLRQMPVVVIPAERSEE